MCAVCKASTKSPTLEQQKEMIGFLKGTIPALNALGISLDDACIVLHSYLLFKEESIPEAFVEFFDEWDDDA